MIDIKRIDPRRPYRLAPTGLKRIVLGDTSGATPLTGPDVLQTNVKPRRTLHAPAVWHMAVVHADRGTLDDAARQAIAAAAILADSSTGVLAVVLGSCRDDLALLGADACAVFDDLDATAFAPEHELALITSLINTYNPAYIFIPDAADATGDLGRRLIVKLKATAATRVAELSHTHAAVLFVGGDVLASTSLPRVVLLAPGAVDATLPYAGEGRVLSNLQIGSPDEIVRDLGIKVLDATAVALEEADFIVSAGNGVTNTATLKALAQSLGAAVGASRVAVDDGKFARAQQIGATGKTVTATTYIAVGISGAVQHLQGIKDCRHVIALNRDAGAPIFNRADLSVIGDSEGVMQALLALIAQTRASQIAPEAAE